ncbi:MAG: ester cyclase [Bacteroidota bacterium]
MKSIFRITFALCTVIMCNQSSFSQVTNKSLEKTNKMDNTKKKEIIHFLYDTIFLKKRYEKLSEIISPDCTNQFGTKGADGFQETIFELTKAFPNAQWEVKEIIADGNKVVVKQKFSGTHKNQFQNIPPTNKTVSVDGIVTYEFKNDKIIGSQIQTDRLGFLQQLGVLPIDLTNLSVKKENPNAIHFIDKFLVPKTSIEEFVKRMNYNRAFIKTLSGFINDQVFEQKDNEGNLTIITIAVWENQDKLNEAKTVIQTEYRRIKFNPIEFYDRLNIKMERGEYFNFKG